MPPADQNPPALKIYNPDGLSYRPKRLQTIKQPTWSEPLNPPANAKPPKKEFFIPPELLNCDPIRPDIRLVRLHTQEQALAVPLSLRTHRFFAIVVTERPGLSRLEQQEYAQSLGLDLGTRAENRILAKRALVPFEIGDLPTQREIELFMAYKENRILDSEGDLGINNQRIHANRKLLNINNKAMCALYVARFPLNMAHF